MSLLDYLRQEYLKGRIIDKYRLKSGNIGLVVEDQYSHKHYHVEFKDGYKGPCIENLYGLLNDPFSGKTEQVNRLVNKGDSIELTVSYSKGPLRQAYHIHSVLSPEAFSQPVKQISLPYGSGQMSRY
jgi:hypothetical protein